LPASQGAQSQDLATPQSAQPTPSVEKAAQEAAASEPATSTLSSPLDEAAAATTGTDVSFPVPPTATAPPSSETVAQGPVAPVSDRDRKAESKARLLELISTHGSQVIALGNGTGCRETEEIVADLIGTSAPDLAYVIVNEAGASVYSTSPVGREEFPDYDATLRSTISIGRRLQDPLSELVKLDPQNVGGGLYQPDVSARQLKRPLEAGRQAGRTA